MPDICLYLQAHRPRRLRRLGVFDLGAGRPWFDDEADARQVRGLARRCYLPVNDILADLIRSGEAGFQVTLSLSGTLIQQLARYAPEALESFQRLVDTGGVDLLGETSHHSFASLADPEELVAQVAAHQELLEGYFGTIPRVFRDTELSYSDDLAVLVAELGFSGLLVEGTEGILTGRSPNHLYASPAAPGLLLLPRNHRLSEDITSGHARRDRCVWPLTADRWMGSVAESSGDHVQVLLDYATFDALRSHTGSFEVLRGLPAAAARRGIRFTRPTTLSEQVPTARVRAAGAVSAADQLRTNADWIGNAMQVAAHEHLYGLRARVLEAGDGGLLEAWRGLGTSDHLYAMSAKGRCGGNAPGDSCELPHDAFVGYMNVLRDLEIRLGELHRDDALTLEDPLRTVEPAAAGVPGAVTSWRPR